MFLLNLYLLQDSNQLQNFYPLKRKILFFLEKYADYYDKMLHMKELIRNIALGLFINGTYAIMKLSADIAPYIITILSVYVMYITQERKEK